MNDQQKQISDLTYIVRKVSAQAEASQFMVKMLLHLHFSQLPDGNAQAQIFGEKVLDYIKRDYSDQPEFCKQIEMMLNDFNSPDSSFIDLVSDTVP